MTSNGWIGVDLDGTLAYYDGWISPEHIGEPIYAMVNRVKKWLEEGKDVRIFTARVWNNNDPHGDKKLRRIYRVIEEWCLEHIGQILPITNQKDYGMIELWDDRAVQIIPNTGQRADKQP